MGVAKISNIFRVLDIPDIFFFGGGWGGLNNKTGSKPADEEKIEYPLGVIYVLIFFLLF